MKLSVAQIKPSKGNIQENIEIHKSLIEIAVSKNADFILFPELSLTGYEPKLTKQLAIEKDDSRLDIFQDISNLNDISIGLGTPTKSANGVQISILIFQPNLPRKVYSKQSLHTDELPFFVEGNEQLILNIENKKLAPAICYESLLTEHAEHAKNMGAEIYLASVAKSQNGINKAFRHYPNMAKRFSMPILMSNCIGFCDNFDSAGHSAIWNSKGELLDNLESDKEGLLIFDTETESVIKIVS